MAQPVEPGIAGLGVGGLGPAGSTVGVSPCFARAAARSIRWASASVASLSV